MKLFAHRWASLSPGARLVLIALAVWVCGVAATCGLLRQDGVREVLYKGF